MLSKFRFAGIAILFLAVVAGPAWAEDGALPAAPGVSIFKTTIETGSSTSVKYTVTGGSLRLQAMVRRLQWAENEVNLVDQLQGLKMDIVASERQVLPALALQRTGYGYPSPFAQPSPVGHGGYGGGSSLTGALSGDLADEATPEAAREAICRLEEASIYLDAELKALQPNEQQAAQGPVDALRNRVAPLLRLPAAAPARPLPVVPPPVRIPAQTVPQPRPMPLAPVGFQQRVPQKQTEVEWHGTWWPAEVVNTMGGRYYIHYTGWDNSWDEWVTSDRIRIPVGSGPLPVVPARLAPGSFSFPPTYQPINPLR